MTTSTQDRPVATFDRRSLLPLADFRLRLTIGQRIDVEIANRYRAAKLAAEVTERLRAL